MGRQRNSPQSRGKEESQERVLNEIKVSKPSHIEFKTMVIREFGELTENYKQLQGSCKRFTVNYMSMKKT